MEDARSGSDGQAFPLSRIIRFGCGFIFACGLLGCLGAAIALFKERDPAIITPLLIVLFGTSITGKMAITGRVPKLLSWANYSMVDRWKLIIKKSKN